MESYPPADILEWVRDKFSDGTGWSIFGLYQNIPNVKHYPKLDG